MANPPTTATTSSQIGNDALGRVDDLDEEDEGEQGHGARQDVARRAVVGDEVRQPALHEPAFRLANRLGFAAVHRGHGGARPGSAASSSGTGGPASAGGRSSR